MRRWTKKAVNKQTTKLFRKIHDYLQRNWPAYKKYSTYTLGHDYEGNIVLQRSAGKWGGSTKYAVIANIPANLGFGAAIKVIENEFHNYGYEKHNIPWIRRPKGDLLPELTDPWA